MRAMEAEDKERKKRLCNSLAAEYHQQCKRYKIEISKEARINIIGSLTSFTKEVVKFTETLQSPMTRTQAAVVLKSGRLLRLCVAGRTVYSQLCVEERDVGHLIAEHLYGKALIVLNKKRSEAVEVLSQKEANKSGKSKKGKKKPSKARPNINNLYETLMDSVSEVTDSIGDLALNEGGHDEKKEASLPNEGGHEEQKEAAPFPMERDATGGEEDVSLDDFLNGEIEFRKDLVHDVLQSDHMSLISDTLWGTTDAERARRESVHLRAFNYVGLRPESVHAFIHTFNNRFLFHHLGNMLHQMTHLGMIQTHEVAPFFDIIVNFTKGLNTKQLELIVTSGPAFWMHDKKSTNHIPTQDGLSRKLRYLSMMANTDPLFVSYITHFPDAMHSLFAQRGDVPDHKLFVFYAQMFGIVPKKPTIGEIVLEGKTFDKSVFDRDVQLSIDSGKKPSSTVDHHTPTFVCFFDKRVPPATRKPMRLPVEILEDADTVKLKVHQPEVDEYVTDVVRHNANTLHVFIPSSHMAYYPATGDDMEIITRGKGVRSVVHMNGREDVLETLEEDVHW